MRVCCSSTSNRSFVRPLLFAFAMGVARAVSSIEECGVYLAPSTIPGAGLGMYAGNRYYEPGELVTAGDIVIPVFELEWHTGHRKIDFLWDEYVWSGDMFEGMEDEVEDIEWIHVASGGMGAAVNCMLPLVNVQDTEDFQMGNSGVKATSPGVGSFTPYHSRTFEAITRIEPGMELYASYGENYFLSRPQNYGYIPMEKNYKMADKLLRRYQNVVNHVASSLPSSVTVSTSESMISDMWTLLLEQSSIWKQSRTLQALPSENHMVEKVLSSGGTAKQHYNTSIRDLTWLQQHGQCMDNIRDGPSTNPNAGRGAFATRYIPEGSLVSPSPLIHLPNRRVLTMFAPKMAGGYLRRNVREPIHQQLLLNYCFGHSESTLLLCPYGLLTNLINHSKQKANTRIQWSESMRHPEWKNRTIDKWGRALHAGLSFDYVALRDIHEGEEIFIDYGDEWEEAWQKHVQQFQSNPPRRSEHYVPAFELNQQVQLKVWTQGEASYDTMGISTYCREHYLVGVGQDDDEYVYQDENGHPLHRCKVLHRSHDNHYIVQILSRFNHEEEEFSTETPHEVFFDVPRDVFYFKDEVYERDHHKTWSFRHDMRIPNDMFPTVWKNIRTDSDVRRPIRQIHRQQHQQQHQQQMPLVKEDEQLAVDERREVDASEQVEDEVLDEEEDYDEDDYDEEEEDYDEEEEDYDEEEELDGDDFLGDEL